MISFLLFKSWILNLGSAFGSKLCIWVLAEAFGFSVLFMPWVLILVFFNQMKGSLKLLSFKQKQEKDLRHNITHIIMLLILYIIYTKWLSYTFYVHMFYIYHVLCTSYIPNSTFHMTKMYLTYARQYFVNFSNNSDKFLCV